ncbi:MAG: hypothetical protein JXR64_08635 [Spirochaetales bacterium]|nr:hypothetical protein [Spirochaetales bacterium]
MKYIYIILLATLLGCGQVDLSVRSNEDIKSDLEELPLLIPVIQSGLSLTNEIESQNITRALAPNSDTIPVSENEIMIKYFGTNWDTAPLKPSEVFTNNSNEVSNDTLRIPQTGTIQGIYNSNNDFYLTLKDLGSNIYRVKLYVYPRNIFEIDYILEDYIVDEDKNNTDSTNSTIWSWSNYDNKGNFDNYINNTVYYRDGTYSNKKIEWSGQNVILNLVKNSAPDLDDNIADVLLNIDNYVYPTEIQLYTNDTSTGQYSSVTSFLLKGSRYTQEGEEFYTEDSQYSYGYTYSDGSKRFDNNKYVTRYIQDRDNNLTNIVSLHTNGDYFTELSRINKTANTYYSESHIWYEAPVSTLNINAASSIILNLTLSGTSYTGTIEQYWGSFGIKHNYEIDTLTGNITISWLNTVSRSLNSGIDLNNLDNIRIGSSDSWEFIGSYEMGNLIGTYKYNNVDYEVVIDLEGIEIESEFLKW